jgi:hypothetical protein
MVCILITISGRKGTIADNIKGPFTDYAEACQKLSSAKFRPVPVAEYDTKPHQWMREKNGYRHTARIHYLQEWNES